MSTRREFLEQTAAAGLLASSFAELHLASAKDASIDTPGSRRTFKIPHTDLTVSRLAFGCAMLGIDWDAADFVARTVPMVELAYDHGITFFDTANVYGYGKSEQAIGAALRRRPGMRNKIVLQSKCGDRFKDGGVVDNRGAYLIEQVEGSLERLGVEHLDILLLHWPDSLVEPQEVAKAFDRLRHSGKVRYFGVSNHSPDQIEILKKYLHQPLVANQIQLGLGHWFVSADLFKSRLTHGAEGVMTLDYCRAHEISVQAYSPLSLTGIGGGGLKSLLQPDADAPEPVKHLAQLLADIAKEHEATPPAIMLAWLLRHPANIIPIIGAIKPEHLIENCTADRIDLSYEEWYSLLQAAALMQSKKASA